jgi:TPR repeat protein
MIAARAALLAALLASPQAFAQSRDTPGPSSPGPSPSGATSPLSAAVMAFRAGDAASAEAVFRRLAPADADAEAWLGVLLLDRGQPREALQTLQHAQAAGSLEASAQLGIVYAQGLAGVPRDEARAAEFFERAAAGGHRRAALNLGILYLRGQGGRHDLVQARAWLEKAASGDDAYALYALGRAMEESEGTAPADPIRAADLYRRAAEKGHPLAELRYGLALAEGSGTKRDFAGAQRWLLTAHADGVPEAALAMGDITAHMPASRDKAVNEKIVQSAFAWYSNAANAGVPSAQFKLANAYLGGSGTARDLAQAVFWYGRAARQGLPEAQHALGLLLFSNQVGTADPVEGGKWLLIAERGEHPDSRAVREKLFAGMADADRKRAEALAVAFTPVLERPLSDAPLPLGAPRP